MATLATNTAALQSQANNMRGYLNNDVLTSKLDNYISRNGVTDIINLYNVDDAELRLMLEHATSYKYRNQLYNVFNQGTLIDMFRMFGAVRKTTMAHRVGHFIAKRFSTQFKATGAAQDSAGGAQTLTLTTAFSPTNKAAAVNIGDIIVYGETQIQVEVVGIDTGDSRLRVMGVTSAGVPMTPGAIGGTTTAHKIVVVPKLNIALPAVTENTGLFVLTNNVEEGSCPKNSIITPYDDEFLFGSTMIRSDIRNTGTANSTGVAELTLKYNGSPIKVVSDNSYYAMKLIHLYKVTGELLFGQKASNPNVLLQDTEVKANNGIFTAAIANGGFYKTYTKGALSYATDIQAMFDFMHQNGIYEAVLLSAYNQFKEIQGQIPQSMWKDNITFSPSIAKKQPYRGEFFHSFDGFSFNFTTSCVEFAGKKIYFKELPQLSDDFTYGSAYAHTGILLPLQNFSVKDAITGETRESFAVNVNFKKDKYGKVRDENNMIESGGASIKRNTNCDIEDISILTDMNVETVGASNIMILQGTN